MRTTGSNHNLACPWCGAVLHYVCTEHRVRPVLGTGQAFAFECQCCKKPVKALASWELTVTAERDNECSFQPQ